MCAQKMGEKNLKREGEECGEENANEKIKLISRMFKRKLAGSMVTKSNERERVEKKKEERKKKKEEEDENFKWKMKKKVQSKLDLGYKKYRQKRYE